MVQTLSIRRGGALIEWEYHSPQTAIHSPNIRMGVWRIRQVIHFKQYNCFKLTSVLRSHDPNSGDYAISSRRLDINLLIYVYILNSVAAKKLRELGNPIL